MEIVSFQLHLVNCNFFDHKSKEAGVGMVVKRSLESLSELSVLSLFLTLHIDM